MKFSVLQFFSWPQRRVPLDVVYERAFERIRIMDQNGFDAVWLAEHHFSTYSVCPSVHLMGMHVANMTSNLRIGMGVSLAAFYHPLRLAEEVALLDVLSGGRVNWGAGRGFDASEMKNFGVPPSESHEIFREHLEIVLQAWEEGALTYHGKYNDFEGVEVLPKPMQETIPHWVAASSPAAVKWSGENGHPILMSPHATPTLTRELYDMYLESLKSSGHSLTRDVPIARLMAIGDSDEEAEAVARQGAAWMLGSYVTQSKATQSHNPTPSSDQRMQLYIDETIIHGCVDHVVDRLNELHEDMYLDYLIAAPLSHRSFLKLVDEVIPRVN